MKSIVPIGITAVIVGTAVAVLSCNWRLETRTPAKSEKTPAPDFSLPAHQGTPLALNDLVKDGPAVVIFYRGYW